MPKIATNKKPVTLAHVTVAKQPVAKIAPPAITPTATKAPTVAAIARTNENILAAVYGFGRLNAHDTEYLRFYRVNADKLGHVPTAKLLSLAVNPFYTGNASRAADNAGYVSRLTKAGFISRPATGGITLTKAGLAHKLT